MESELLYTARVFVLGMGFGIFLAYVMMRFLESRKSKGHDAT